jgi:pimeloyl-ACP methyl ester carboxylesterase
MLENLGAVLRDMLIEGPRAFFTDYEELIARGEGVFAPHIGRLRALDKERVALELAGLVHLAYRAESEDLGGIGSALSDIGYTDVEYLPRSTVPFVDGATFKDGRLGFVVRRQGRVVVALRGTVDAADWMTNLLGAVLADDSGSQALYKAWADAIADRVLSYVDRTGPPEHVILTGHSMGGAIAILVQAAYRHSGGPGGVVETVAFGAPGTGWPYPDIEPAVLLVRQGADVVPFFAHELLPHAGQQYLLDEQGRLIHLDQTVASYGVFLLNNTRICARCGSPDDLGGKYLLSSFLSKFAEKDLTRPLPASIPLRGPATDFKVTEEHSILSYISLLERGQGSSAGQS